MGEWAGAGGVNVLYKNFRYLGHTFPPSNGSILYMLLNVELSANIYVYRNVATMRDYGKSLKWPAPPIVLKAAVNNLKLIHNRWRAWMVLRRVPKEEWQQLRHKVKLLLFIFHC
jgi:hypothetical protein